MLAFLQLLLKQGRSSVTVEWPFNLLIRRLAGCLMIDRRRKFMEDKDWGSKRDQISCVPPRALQPFWAGWLFTPVLLVFWGHMAPLTSVEITPMYLPYSLPQFVNIATISIRKANWLSNPVPPSGWKSLRQRVRSPRERLWSGCLEGPEFKDAINGGKCKV